MKISLPIAALYAAAILGAVYAAEYQVQPHEAVLRETPDSFGKKVADLENGEYVETTGDEKDDYFPVKVKATGATGWIATSDVIEPKDFKATGTATSTAKEGEQGAFVKGFDPEVEKKYREDHPDLNSIYDNDVNPMIRKTTCGGLGLGKGELDDLEEEKLTLQLQANWTQAKEDEYAPKFKAAEGVRAPALKTLMDALTAFRKNGFIGEYAKGRK